MITISCNDSNHEEIKNINPEIQLLKPSNFPDFTYNFKKNPLTKEGVQLGRMLFYEGDLSADGATDCASCHIQENAFTHHGHSFSHGAFNRVGFRNSLPIQNLAFYSDFTWDGSITDLDTQPIVPITTHEEMDENFPSIIVKLSKKEKYKTQFNKAFASEEMTADKILKALSQFMVMMISADSKYDKVVRKEGVSFTKEESEGLEIFNNKCSSCHSTDLFTDGSFRNNGLALDPTINDLGRFRLTNREEDKEKFRVPSLRNVAITNPYMHDGRFSTLEAVLNHYSDGMVNHQNLDAEFKKNKKIGIALSETEKQKIIMFLKTLTDEKFIKNPNFSSP